MTPNHGRAAAFEAGRRGIEAEPRFDHQKARTAIAWPMRSASKAPSSPSAESWKKLPRKFGRAAPSVAAWPNG